MPPAFQAALERVRAGTHCMHTILHSVLQLFSCTILRRHWHTCLPASVVPHISCSVLGVMFDVTWIS